MPTRLPELLYRIAWNVGLRPRASSSAQRALFTRIHERNEWASAESRSGPGSTRARGDDFRAALEDLLARLEVASLLDAPCGDFNWMRDVAVPEGMTYAGMDIVEPLILQNRARFAHPNRRFEHGDLTRDALPQVDLILCRDGLVHLSHADAHAALANFRRSRSRYLLATTFPDVATNADIPTGAWRPLNLQAPPFSLPPPLTSIDDIPAARKTEWGRKSLSLWKLN